MQQYVFWIVTTMMGLVIAIIGYFIKRTLTHIEDRQKSTEETLIKRLDSLKQESEARTNKTDQDVERLRERLDGMIEALPRQYVQKEDWLLGNQTVDRKLDRIMEILMDLKGRGTE